jgi:hypothetical protein
LYNIYLEEMRNQPVPFVEVKGSEQQRVDTALAAIDKFILKNQ